MAAQTRKPRPADRACLSHGRPTYDRSPTSPRPAKLAPTPGNRLASTRLGAPVEQEPQGGRHVVTDRTGADARWTVRPDGVAAGGRHRTWPAAGPGDLWRERLHPGVRRRPGRAWLRRRGTGSVLAAQAPPPGQA